MEMIKARAHMAAHFLSKGRKNRWSVEAQKYMMNEAIFRKYGIEKDSIYSKYLEKGLLMESDSLRKLSDLDGYFYTKNTERKSNDYVSGECDTLSKHSVIDIKSSWDIFTFNKMKIDGISKLYEYQLRCYMDLYDKPEAEVVFVLNDPTESLLTDEHMRIQRNYSDIDSEFEANPEMLAAFQKDLEALDNRFMLKERLSLEARVHRIKIERDDELTAKLYDFIAEAQPEFLRISKLV